MTRSFGLIALGVVSVLAALITLGAYVYSQPTVLRVATGNEVSEISRILVAVQQAMARDRSPVRLNPVLKNSQPDIAEAMKRGETDLAIVRSDQPFPINAQVVAVWQRNPLYLVTKPGSPIKRWGNLNGRKVGIVGVAHSAPALFEFAARQNDVDRRSVEMVAVPAANAGEMLQSGAVDAIFTFGPPSARTVKETMQSLARAMHPERPVIVPIKENEAIAERASAFEQADIMAGTFGVNPPFPEETVETLAVIHLLVANRALSEATITTLTEQLFQQRRSLSALEEGASRIEAADTDKDAAFPVHPGALAYYKGEQKTFLERYSDLIYMAIFGLSLGGSGLAAMVGVMRSGTRRDNRAYLREATHLIRTARHADTGERLDDVATRADDLLMAAVERSSEGMFDDTEFTAISMTLDHLRAVIADRRRALQLEVMAYESDYFDEEGAPVPPPPPAAAGYAPPQHPDTRRAG